MKKANFTLPRKKGSLFLLLLLTLSLLCTSCGPNGSKPYYECSPRADVGGETHTVVDVTIPRQCVDVTDPNVVTLTVGMGGDFKPELYQQMSAVLRITAKGCLINGTEDFLEIEYPNCFGDEDFLPTVEENRWTYPVKTPNFYEDFEITFPTEECTGSIVISLYIADTSRWQGTTREPIQGVLLGFGKISFHYASNGTVIWFNDRPLRRVDENNRPVSVDDIPADARFGPDGLIEETDDGGFIS